MQPLKILHVEDEIDIRDIAAIALAADPSIEHCTASSGLEALDALAAGTKPDVILLDVVMPQMDGPSTLARIRTMPGHEHTPVIFMTARTQPQEKSRYLALGAIGVISKPFDPMTLGQQIRDLLAEAPK
jgi:CheY-like chemotaxis protein